MWLLIFVVYGSYDTVYTHAYKHDDGQTYMCTYVYIHFKIVPFHCGFNYLVCPNCAGAEYKPVCTPANQTLPSRCVAKCQGWRDDQLTDGNCGEFSSCTVHECPVGTWLV